MTGSGIASRDRLPSLTGLRFWAALLVVGYHLTTLVAPLPVLSPLTQFGRSGVTFFFVLSGFVLAWTYLDTPTPFHVFLWRRFARLWPMVLVTGLLSLAAFRYVGQEVPAVRALTTFVFLQAWSPGWAVGANGAAWSLSDEAFFYLLFPGLLLIASRRRGRRVLGAAALIAVPVLWVVASLAGWTSYTLDYLPLTRVVQFTLGVVAGVAMRRGMRAPVPFWAAVALVVGYHLLLVPWRDALPPGDPFGAFSGSQWWSAPVFLLLIMAAAQNDVDGRATGVRGPWSIRLGHWSYAWYLVHEIVIRTWVHRFGHPVGTAETMLVWALLLAVSLGLAGLLFTVVERPAERWLRRNGPQVRARPVAASATSSGTSEEARDPAGRPVPRTD